MSISATQKISNPLTDKQIAKKLGLLDEEFDRIVSILGRVPNFTELSMFAAMWSEHCSYKNSLHWLKKLPKEGKHLLAKAGEENAGLVDIGDNLACAFKIESHNHPSAIEPYQGAATGVGGINRDIFTMGARPIAQLNSLRFGNIENKKTQWLIRGVVKGIGDYGNAFGVPTVAGEVFFDESFTDNPLVNAMSVGIVEKNKTVKAIAEGEGNPVFIVGSATGKDGIHGAAFASKDITKNSVEDLPAVQVGDPFQEKLLLEATLEIIETGAVVGMQDMGAAGITCSTSEMSAKGNHGMIIWLDKVPLRQSDMQPFEILLSESQERMLVVVKKGREEEVIRIFEKWDLNCVQIGVVTKEPILKYYYDDELVAEVPADALVVGGGAPVYIREFKEPAYYAENKKFNINTIPDIKDKREFEEVAKFIMSHPNIASKRWVYEQYDSMVRINNMSTNFPSDAAVVNIHNTEKALALSVDCNSRYVYADPEIGTAIAVSEAARNIICSGGEPVAITNCLNFGNPYNPEVYWQFVGAIKGMSTACEKFDTPVTGGNVSFYNQSENGAVFPTPTIGMLGILKNKKFQTTLSFQNEDDLIVLIGKVVNDIAASEYLYSYRKYKHFPAPYFNLNEEYNTHQSVKEAIQSGILISAHDVSDGGLFTTLCESAFEKQLGFEVNKPADIRTDAFYFGEAQGRIVVSILKKDIHLLKDICQKHQTDCLEIGKVLKKKVIIDGTEYGNIDKFKDVYLSTFPKYMEE
ncbi:MAG: phosphoribosylformylglycinamidine synthase subunit PurL [Bacteroidia bacterium]|nr:phosphoribosylformylglycinamidine synthase subunit PurL [Bacteroidia bacterium]